MTCLLPLDPPSAVKRFPVEESSSDPLFRLAITNNVPEVKQHLKWMLQKNELGQDMLLFGYVLGLINVTILNFSVVLLVLSNDSWRCGSANSPRNRSKYVIFLDQDARFFLITVRKQSVLLCSVDGPFEILISVLFPQYISLSRDTSSSDIKQRREIEHGEAVFVDQAAVQAARNGVSLL